MVDTEQDFDNELDIEEINSSSQKNNTAKINDTIDRKMKELEIQKLRLKNYEIQQANELRGKFAKWSGFYVTFFTICSIITTWLAATKANRFCGIQFNNPFTLSDTVLIALLTTFTAQIVGVVIFVMIYLFKNIGNNKDKNE